MTASPQRRLLVAALAAWSIAAGCDRDVWIGHAEDVASPEIVALAEEIDAERYVSHLFAFPAARWAGSEELAMARGHCADALLELGFDVERQTFESGTNVVATRPGETRERVILAATTVGSDEFPSYLAGLLEIATVLATRNYERTLVVVCWEGSAGAEAFAAREEEAGQDIAALIHLDDIVVYNEAPDTQQIPENLDLLYPDAYDELVANEYRGDFVLTTGNELSRSVRHAFGVYAEAVGLRHFDLEIPLELEESDFVTTIRGAERHFWSRGYPGMRVSDANVAGARALPDPPPVHPDFPVAVMRATVGAAVTELVLSHGR